MLFIYGLQAIPTSIVTISQRLKIRKYFKVAMAVCSFFGTTRTQPLFTNS